jgi:hypothetical protein
MFTLAAQADLFLDTDTKVVVHGEAVGDIPGDKMS